MVKYQIVGAHTHTETHACTHAHTHAQVVVTGGMHNLQRTYFSPTISKYSNTELLKGLELAYYTIETSGTSREG